MFVIRSLQPDFSVAGRVGGVAGAADVSQDQRYVALLLAGAGLPPDSYAQHDFSFSHHLGHRTPPL